MDYAPVKLGGAFFFNYYLIHLKIFHKVIHTQNEIIKCDETEKFPEVIPFCDRAVFTVFLSVLPLEASSVQSIH